MAWNDIVQKSKRMGVSPGLVLREELQKGALTALSRTGSFNHIVFQGGTALRIFYNSPRFSEDLDFVLRGGESFDLTSRIEVMERYLSSEFYYLDGLKVYIQKDAGDLQRATIRTFSDAPAQRLSVNVELFSVPSYRNSLRILQYPPLNPVVRVEELEEILADKIVAVSLRRYLKGRDIWDIHYLTHELNISASRNLVERKAEDYGVRDLREKMEKSIERLLKQGVASLDREMKRFLPAVTYAQLKPDFEVIVRNAAREIKKVVIERGKEP